MILIAAIALAVAFGSCSKDSEDEEDTYTVSGKFLKAVVADGLYGYGKLVASGGQWTDTALYQTKSAPFSGGSASFSIPEVAKGDYTCYAFIDVNGNAVQTNPVPDTGDWITRDGANISVSSDFAKDVPEDAWVTY